ncbi:ROK family protein [Kibdelosporangium lantanae]|uniref:ROK family protein n=1 Tax=Kibdelosporangium lantanae TaxID=1497396 RepID=A0ABW3M2K5_9PSEU
MTDVVGERGNRVHLGNVVGAAVGVDVGHQEMTVAVRRIGSEEIERDWDSVGAQKPRAVWTKRAKEMIKDLTAQLDLTPDDVVSIGLGLPVAIYPATATITQVVATSEWDLVGRPADWFADEFPDVPVIPDNDANLAAYGEYLHGAGRGAHSMIYVKASSGIGAGHVAGDGVIKRGRHGLAGELGHLTVDRNGSICRCGSKGCLETVAAGPRLLDQVREAYKPYDTKPPADLDDLINRALNDDVVCCRVLKGAAQNIGFALTLACNIVNPALVVLGGTLGKAADLMIPPLAAAMREYGLAGMFTHDNPVRIVGSELGDLAGARGAMALGLLTEPPVRSSRT